MAFTVYSTPPIPPDPASTTYVDAGSLRIGVEYRLLNDAELTANYEGDELDEVQAAVVGDLEDNGVSIHVENVADGKEHLRFDCFSKGPHYHYIEPTGMSQTIVDYDVAAMGEMLPWVIGQLRGRIEPMLVRAGGEALVPSLDRSALAEAIGKVEHLARAAEAELAGPARG